MNSRYRSIIVFFTALLAAILTAGLMCAGCRDEIEILYNSSPDNVVVKYSSGGGLVPLSEDQMPLFRLFGDGRVVRRSADSKTGLMVEGRLNRAEVAKLLREVEEAGFFKLKNEYFNRDIMDAPSSIVVVDLKNDFKAVTVYAMDVEGFARTIEALMAFPVPGLKTYVPEKGSLVVQSVDPANLEKDNYQQVADLLPPINELEAASGAGRAVEIDGARFAKLKQLESDTGRYGTEVVIDGRGYRIFPVYEPSARL